MSILLVVRKDTTACMVADTLTTFGQKRLPDTFNVDSGKIMSVGSVSIGMVGSPAHQSVLQSLFESGVEFPDVERRAQLFEFMRQIHPRLKEEYFLNPHDEDEDPYESSQMDLLVMTRHGIFGVLSLREVYEYSRFWALGSGADYALGAMHAVYETPISAEEVADAGFRAAITFDVGSSAERPTVATVSLG